MLRLRRLILHLSRRMWDLVVQHPAARSSSGRQLQQGPDSHLRRRMLRPQAPDSAPQPPNVGPRGSASSSPQQPAAGSGSKAPIRHLRRRMWDLSGSASTSAAAARAASSSPQQPAAGSCSKAPDSAPQAPNAAPQAPDSAPQPPNVGPGGSASSSPQQPAAGSGSEAPDSAPQAPNAAPQAPDSAPQPPNVGPRVSIQHPAAASRQLQRGARFGTSGAECCASGAECCASGA